MDGTYDSERWQRVEALFNEALDRPRAARDAFLEEACAGDAELVAEVRSLLDADTTGHSLLDGNALDAVNIRDIISLEGTQVGPYRVIDQIATGGMGAVYLAERADGQFDQRVALKVIKRGMDSEEILSRFHAERQILARLTHPNIARLLDGGLTPEGLPYFTMEYVEGVPIDRYCDDNRLGISDRIELFATVCDAVRYAQRSLVVHRDLKPGNIMVTEDGTVKLLDFGIAKAMGDDDDSGMTRTGVRVMTPRYAAPEQVRGEPVSTATDVYALGVILYELLCGARPYAGDTDTPRDIEKAIVDTSPARPSDRVTSPDSAEVSTSPGMIAAVRASEPARLERRLRGDLDNICLMALRKESERRYSSAQQLLDDIRRHREGRTVNARPDTARYRFEKFMERNRAGVIGTVAIFLMIVTVITFYTTRLAAERDRAQLEAQKAETVSGFLTGLFEVSDPGESPGETVTARELLDRGAERIEEELGDQPEVQAQMYDVVGSVYHQLGMFAQAESLLTRGLNLRRGIYGDESEEVLQSLGNIVNVVYEKGDHEATFAMVEEVLELRIRYYGEEDTLVALSYNDLGWVSYEAGRYEEAEAYHRRALAMRIRLLGVMHVSVAESQNNLATAVLSQNQFEEADSLYVEALAIRRALLGDTHPLVAYTIANIAVLAEQRGDLAKAEQFYRESLDLQRRAFDEDHPDLATPMVNLGRVLRFGKKFDEAQTLLEGAIALDRSRGADHPYVAYDMCELAALFRDRGDAERGVAEYESAIAIYRVNLDDDHGYITSASIGLGASLVEAGELVRADSVLTVALARLDVENDDSFRLGATKSWLGRCYTLTERYEDAHVLLVEGYENLVSALGPNDPRTAEAADRVTALYAVWEPPAGQRLALPLGGE